MNVDFNTDMLYYQIEENDERLYDIFIDDNTTDEIKNLVKPEIGEEDKKNMFETKKVIEDKGLKEYALLNMKEEFNRNLKKTFRKIHFGPFFRYDGTESWKISDNAIVDLMNIDDDGGIENSTIVFKEIDVGNIEKVKLSDIFLKYEKYLNKEMNYLSDNENGKIEEELNGERNDSNEVEISIVSDELIYEYYHERQSPLGEYFYYKKTDKQGEEDTYNHERNSVRSMWSYDGVSENIADKFCNALNAVQKKNLNIGFLSNGEIYRFKTGKNYIDDVWVDSENNIVYFMEVNTDASNILDSYIYDDLADLDNKKLCKANLSDGMLSAPEVIDDRAEFICFIFEGKLYYTKDGYSAFDIALYCDGKELKKGFNTVMLTDDTVYLRKKNDEGIDATYDLYMLDDYGNVKEMVSGIFEYQLLENKIIVYIDNYNWSTGKGDLKLWYKGNTELIDNDVVSIIGGENAAQPDYINNNIAIKKISR